jgi:DNA topoisomerase-2
MSTKDITRKYQILDEVEHVLKRPGMYIGSTKPHQSQEWLQIPTGEFRKLDIEYNPGFLKLFDEIVSNSVDESKRNPNLNQIWVEIKGNQISVKDNGGIPVLIHEDAGTYIPEMIFSNLRAGSNFDDTQERTVAGTNGVGASLTNIFSDSFEIRTADGKKEFRQTFTKNMSNKTEPKISNSTAKYTQIIYTTDFSQFGMTEIDDTHIQMIRKRLQDISACNSNLKISFKGPNGTERFNYRNFKQYVDLYTSDSIYESSDNWEIAVAPSTNGHQVISYVNSIETKDGGTHVNNVMHGIIEGLRALIKRKHKVDVRPSDIKNQMMFFLNCTVINPAFSSQTKEKLITEPREFGSTHEVTQRFINKIFGSEVIASVLDWIDRKKVAEEKAKLRKLNKGLSAGKILKLIDAKSRSNRENCTLGLFEGMSALSAVRKFRDAQTFGAFPLKGKFLNVSGMKPTQIIKSAEVVDLMGAIGLRLGEDLDNLRYGKILIYTDADPDGDAISALLINFFDRFWPELFDEGRMYKVQTPLVVAKKLKQTLYFYTQSEYDEWESKTTDIRKWEVEYKKGLASLEDNEYEEIIKNPRLIRIKNDKQYRQTLDAWFGGDSNARKRKLLNK